MIPDSVVRDEQLPFDILVALPREEQVEDFSFPIRELKPLAERGRSRSLERAGKSRAARLRQGLSQELNRNQIRQEDKPRSDPTEKYTGESRGFGFVEMPNKDEADKAIAGLNGKDLKGRALTINEARPRTENRPWTGGFGGGRSSGGRGGFGGGRRF